MRYFTRLSAWLLAMCAVATAWADVPFKVTTIENGEFAKGTTWYTMTCAANRFYLSDNGTADHIALNRPTSDFEDADLWCFVGTEAEGFTIYNKQGGTGKVLSSPATMSGETGATAYVVLKATDAITAADVTKWGFTASADLNPDASYYMYQFGTTANKVNNRSGKLAFWTGGADAGSCITITASAFAYDVNMGAGAFTAFNGNKTWASRWESAAEPKLSLATSANNMSVPSSNETTMALAPGNGGCTYTLAVPTGYRVASYSFKASTPDATKAPTLTPAGQKGVQLSTTPQTFNVQVPEDGDASFTLSAPNVAYTFTDFVVNILVTAEKPEPQFEVFPTITAGAIPYRIPAIATAKNGNLVAVADYRWNRRDIGMGGDYGGRIDLHCRISKDNGATWGDIFSIVNGQGKEATDAFYTGFGDPVIVADRESDKVLLFSCAGNVSFPNGQRNNHQHMATCLSEDGGETWGEPRNLGEMFYELLDNSTRGPIRSMFIGSGKIHQSRYTKVGDYYRLYCAGLVKDVNGTHCNYIYYSDDFGTTWKLLGDPNTPPIPSGGDEPKAEELPDGSVIISSRISGGRGYNIFTFTDVAKGEGVWANQANSNSSNNGTVALGNSTNGELLLIPAKRKADGASVWMALQSVPFGNGRSNVGIYYKELESKADWATPAAFAANWDGRHQASRTGSAYSTMIVQPNGHIAFLYEEDTYGVNSGGGYNILYKDYTLEQITDSLYEYFPAMDLDTYNKEKIVPFLRGQVDDLFAETTTAYIGNLLPEGKTAALEALAAYEAAPTMENLVALNVTMHHAPALQLQHDHWYTLSNKLYPTFYLTSNRSSKTIKGAEATTLNAGHKFTFAANEDGKSWKIYSQSCKRWLGATPATNASVTLVEYEEAADYLAVSNAAGETYLQCLTPTESGYPALHMNSGKSIVPWTTAADASRWYIAEAEGTPSPTGIEFVEAAGEDESASTRYYDLSGRAVSTPQKGVYVTDKKKKIIVR